MRDYAPAVQGYVRIGDDGVLAFHGIGRDFHTLFPAPQFLHDRGLRQIDNFLPVRMPGVKRKASLGIHDVNGSLRADADSLDPFEQPLATNLQYQNACYDPGRVLDRRGHREDLELWSSLPDVNRRYIRTPLAAHSLEPLAVREIDAAHIGKRRHVGPERSFDVGEEQPFNLRQVVRHGAHDLDRFGPFSLCDEFPEPDAGSERNGDIRQAFEL